MATLLRLQAAAPGSKTATYSYFPCCMSALGSFATHWAMPERLSPSPLNPVCSPQAKRKKPSVPEKPAKKQKSGGETSRASGSARPDGNRDDNLFQVLHLHAFTLTRDIRSFSGMDCFSPVSEKNNVFQVIDTSYLRDASLFDIMEWIPTFTFSTYLDEESFSWGNAIKVKCPALFLLC